MYFFLQTWSLSSKSAMGSSSQESSTSTSRNTRTRPFLGLENTDNDDDDDSFTSSTPISTPISPISGPSSYPPIVVSGLQSGKRAKMSRTEAPPPPTPQMDTKVYDFIDKVLERTQESKPTGYAPNGYKILQKCWGV